MSGSSSSSSALMMGRVTSPRVCQKLCVTGGDKCQYSPVLVHHHHQQQQQQQCGSRSELAGLSIDLPQCRPVRALPLRAPEAPRTGDGGWSWAGLGLGLTHTIPWSQCSYILSYHYPYLQLLYRFINRSFRFSIYR